LTGRKGVCKNKRSINDRMVSDFFQTETIRGFEKIITITVSLYLRIRNKTPEHMIDTEESQMNGFRIFNR